MHSRIKLQRKKVDVYLATRYSGSNIVFIIMVWKYLSDIWLISPHKPAEDISITTFIFLQYDSSELGEELCPVSSSLPLRVHKVCIRVSFSDTFLRMSYKGHSSHIHRGPSWPWSYGSWIYNYLCNQCLSPLMMSSKLDQGEVYTIMW
jgi:hypothetical protein